MKLACHLALSIIPKVKFHVAEHITTTDASTVWSTLELKAFIISSDPGELKVG